MWEEGSEGRPLIQPPLSAPAGRRKREDGRKSATQPLDVVFTMCTDAAACVCVCVIVCDTTVRDGFHQREDTNQQPLTLTHTHTR